MKTEQAQHIHLIGIGGAGMSGVARILCSQGKQVTGSDRSPSVVTAHLQQEGVTVGFDQTSESLPDGVDLVVATAAIPQDNPELQAAKAKNIPCILYTEALGEISKKYKTIAVAGTHGKTTTTAMIAKVLIDAGLDPTVLVGSEVPFLEGNVHVGTGEYFVVEADEFNRNFLSLDPWLVVITNLEADHLDYYRDLDEIVDAFYAFVQGAEHIILDTKYGKEGTLLLQQKLIKAEVTQYGTALDNIPELIVPGTHNRANAAAALCAALKVGVSKDVALQSLQQFNGTARRFELLGKTANGATVIDDYAHHPTEVMAVIEAAKARFIEKKIVAVFEPHLFSRTKLLMNDFKKAFSGLDELLLLSAYQAREKVSTEEAADVMETLRSGIKEQSNVLVELLDTYNQVIEQLQSAQEDTVVIVMGAGPVTEVAHRLVVSKLEKS